MIWKVAIPSMPLALFAAVKNSLGSHEAFLALGSCRRAGPRYLQSLTSLFLPLEAQ